MMPVIGVDGCRSGWLAVRSQGGCECGCQVRVIPSIREVWMWGGGEALILVDVPVGLSDAGSRLCDSEARRRLGFPRSTSVFSPPVRRALLASGWREAADMNERLTGKRISQQAWGIAQKIREVDEFLRANPQRQRRFREVHPELLFWSLNGQRAMRMPKRRAAGRAERLALLANYWPAVRRVFERERRQLRGQGAAADDLIDALLCVVAAHACAARFQALPKEPPLDSAGLRMEILYPDPEAIRCGQLLQAEPLHAMAPLRKP